MAKLTKDQAEAIADSMLGAQAARHAENRAERAGPVHWTLVSKDLMRLPAVQRQVAIDVAKARLASSWIYWLIVGAVASMLGGLAWWWNSELETTVLWLLPLLVMLISALGLPQKLALRWHISRVLTQYPTDDAGQTPSDAPNPGSAGR